MSVCIVNTKTKRNKTKRKNRKNKETSLTKCREQDGKEEEGAELARGKCKSLSSFRYVIRRRRRGKTAFGFLHSLALASFLGRPPVDGVGVIVASPSSVSFALSLSFSRVCLSRARGLKRLCVCVCLLFALPSSFF